VNDPLVPIEHSLPRFEDFEAILNLFELEDTPGPVALLFCTVEVFVFGVIVFHFSLESGVRSLELEVGRVTTPDTRLRTPDYLVIMVASPESPFASDTVPAFDVS